MLPAEARQRDSVDPAPLFTPLGVRPLSLPAFGCCTWSRRVEEASVRCCVYIFTPCEV